MRLRAQLGPMPRASVVAHLDAEHLLDELSEDHLTLSVNLAGLEVSVAEAPHDASARAAVRTLEARVADLRAICEALANAQAATTDPRFHRLAVPDSPLADYLRGIYAWVHAVVRALDHLARSLRALRPDWALLRWRIEEAKNFHFDELHDPIRVEVHALAIVANGGAFGSCEDGPAIQDLEYALERLFATGIALEEHLDERFG